MYKGAVFLSKNWQGCLSHFLAYIVYVINHAHMQVCCDCLYLYLSDAVLPKLVSSAEIDICEFQWHGKQFCVMTGICAIEAEINCINENKYFLCLLWILALVYMFVNVLYVRVSSGYVYACVCVWVFVCLGTCIWAYVCAFSLSISFRFVFDPHTHVSM